MDMEIFRVDITLTQACCKKGLEDNFRAGAWWDPCGPERMFLILQEVEAPSSLVFGFPLRAIRLSFGWGSKPMVPFWGRCTTHFRTYFSWEWEVYWG